MGAGMAPAIVVANRETRFAYGFEGSEDLEGVVNGLDDNLSYPSDLSLWFELFPRLAHRSHAARVNVSEIGSLSAAVDDRGTGI